MSERMRGVEMAGTADIREVEVRGDWAWLRNFIDITVTPPGGQPVRRSGYTLSILCKEPDGRWLLLRDANLVS
jgi:ketosteroid isomerase-like protein